MVASGTHDDLDYLVEELRDRVRCELPANYDTNFNLKRWIINADKLSRSVGNVALAERHLRHHLRFRNALKLDDADRIPSWDENPIYKDRLLPRGHFEWIASHNCFLWWVDYSTLNMTALVNSHKSTDILVYHFWKYECMLRMVNEKERTTGVMCHVYAVIDLHDWPISPLTVLFVNDGQMSYYANLFHYEHYPELVNPINMINAPTWISLPYNLVRSTMPRDFGNRFRILNHRYADTVFKDLPIDQLAIRSDAFVTIPSRYGKHDKGEPPSRNAEPGGVAGMHHIQVSARRRSVIPVECKAGSKLLWHFTTDSALQFGIFFHPTTDEDVCKVDIDRWDMVYPMLRFAAKHVPETGALSCSKSGTYYLVFCNKSSWLSRRHVYIKLEVETSEGVLRKSLQRSFSG